MDRVDQSWRRSAAAGFVALAVSVGGAVAAADSEVQACSAQRTTSGAQWVLLHLAPHVEAPPLVTKIARAALEYAFGTTCS